MDGGALPPGGKWVFSVAESRAEEDACSEAVAGRRSGCACALTFDISHSVTAAAALHAGGTADSTQRLGLSDDMTVPSRAGSPKPGT